MAEKKFYKLKGSIIACLYVLVLLNTLAAQSQSGTASTQFFAEAKIRTDKTSKAPAEIRFAEGKGVPVASFFENYKKAFGLSNDNEIRALKVFSDELGQTHHRCKQYYKGVELAEVQFLLHEKNGAVFYAHGPLVHGLDLEIQPNLTEPEALQRALAHLGAESYMWQNKSQESHLRKEQNDAKASYYPKGELRLSAGKQKMVTENFRLVYRFDIYAEKPLGRYHVDVDAQNGEVINVISLLQHGDVRGVGNSFYNSAVPITVNDELTSTTGSAPHWHPDSWNALGGSGQSWWAADPALGDQGGYENHWYEALDTDPISLNGANPRLTFYHRYAVETPGGEPAGYNGWDGMNVRISSTADTSWRVLSNPTPAYSRSSLYSFGFEFGEGTGIPGWAGRLDTWTQVSFDLSAYAGQTVRLRFAFASDPGLSTTDNAPDLYGWQIDDLVVSSASGVLYSNDGVATGITARNLVREVSFIPGKYRLREAGRAKGIFTYDARNGTVLDAARDFVAADSNFTAPNDRRG